MNITVIGCGKSGFAAAKLAVDRGYKVHLTESRDIDKYQNEYEELKSIGVACEFGINSYKYLDNCDMVICSPGIARDNKFIRESEKRNIPVISEIEFAFRHTNGKVVSVTGTNGKTTTTALINYILRSAGNKSVACGNIGYAFSEAVLNNDDDTIYVVEASSYQLDRISTFKPDVALILNISPDHLEYHKSMENYICAKWKTSSLQNENNLLILNADDKTILENSFKTSAKIGYFSSNPVGWGIYTKGNEIFFKTADKEELLMVTEQLGLPGIHNIYNSMAAALAARFLEVTNEDIRDSLISFRGVEHRLEYVRTLAEVDFVNDSKATNINATWFALSSYKKPLIWIAGGRAKGNDYSELDLFVKNNVKAIICIGEESENIFNHFCSNVRCIKASTLHEAVINSIECAERGDLVLFSPACKSFDMFMNFEQRGDEFKSIVMDL